MASMLSHATVQKTLPETGQTPAPAAPADPAASAESAQELGRALTDGLRVLEADAPKDPSYWWG